MPEGQRKVQGMGQGTRNKGRERDKGSRDQGIKGSREGAGERTREEKR